MKHYVEHNYHDHLLDPIVEDTTDEATGAQKRRAHRGGVAVPFPEKLHYMLSQVDGEGVSHIVSWQPHGRCFIVHKPQEFVQEVMSRFFKQTKLTSFQRQLNLYGFVRLTAGTDRGGYYHELFLRGRMDLCRRMSRTRVKGNGSKGASSPETEPNFYKMKPAFETTSSSSLGEMGVHTIVSEETSNHGGEEAARVEHSSHNNAVPIEVQVPYDTLSSIVEEPATGLDAVTPSLPQTPSQVSLPLVSPVIEQGKRIISGPHCNLTSHVPMPHDLFDFSVHSGDMLHFEGLPFHYLETKDVEESLILEI
jgi:hypothetical protein